MSCRLQVLLNNHLMSQAMILILLRRQIISNRMIQLLISLVHRLTRIYHSQIQAQRMITPNRQMESHIYFCLWNTVRIEHSKMKFI